MMNEEQKKKRILAVVGLLFVIGVSSILAANSFIRYRNDFFARWYSTTKLFKEDRNLYNIQNGLEVVEYSNFPDPKQADFYYPAHLLAFTGPLALLPYPAALFLWIVAIQLFYIVGLWLVIDKVNWPSTIGQRTWVLMAAILFIPYLQHTFWGQFNTIAVLSLSLTYLALRADRFFLAGCLAIGLTFKPQGTGLVLVFLILWALLLRRRWPFLLGIGFSSIIFWIIAEVLQPNWVVDFMASLEGYIPTRSVIDRFWNPHQLISALLVLGSLGIFGLNRSAESDSHVFAAELILSFGVWALVVPIIGMMHMVLLPVLLVLLMIGLKTERPKYYRFALWIFGMTYVLGWVGFAIGLLVPEFYGNHIIWSELAYKVFVPIMLILFAIPLSWRGFSSLLNPGYDS